MKDKQELIKGLTELLKKTVDEATNIQMTINILTGNKVTQKPLEKRDSAKSGRQILIEFAEKNKEFTSTEVVDYAYPILNIERKVVAMRFSVLLNYLQKNDILISKKQKDSKLKIYTLNTKK